MNGKYEIGDYVLSNWKLVKELGAGAYGKVYEAHRDDFGVIYKAAIKIITIPQSQTEVLSAKSEGMSEEEVTDYFRSVVRQIVNECAFMSKVKGNSYIVGYEDHVVVPHEGMVGWDIIIRMELLTPLIKYVNYHSMTLIDTAKLGVDICHALEICKKMSIIHRDVKPENIMISDMGDYKLGDFGISRTLEETQGGLSKKGTVSYMAPEVAKGEAYGPTVDIYSLGIVMYRFLNNNRGPFLPEAPSPITYHDRENANARRFGGEALPMPKQADAELGRIVLKACAYNARDRYDSPIMLRKDLELWLKSQDVDLYQDHSVPVKPSFEAEETQMTPLSIDSRMKQEPSNLTFRDLFSDGSSQEPKGSDSDDKAGGDSLGEDLDEEKPVDEEKLIDEVETKSENKGKKRVYGIVGAILGILIIGLGVLWINAEKKENDAADSENKTGTEDVVSASSENDFGTENHLEISKGIDKIEVVKNYIDNKKYEQAIKYINDYGSENAELIDYKEKVYMLWAADYAEKAKASQDQGDIKKAISILNEGYEKTKDDSLNAQAKELEELCSKVICSDRMNYSDAKAELKVFGDHTIQVKLTASNISEKYVVNQTEPGDEIYYWNVYFTDGRHDYEFFILHTSQRNDQYEESIYDMQSFFLMVEEDELFHSKGEAPFKFDGQAIIWEYKMTEAQESELNPEYSKFYIYAIGSSTPKVHIYYERLPF